MQLAGSECTPEVNARPLHPATAPDKKDAFSTVSTASTSAKLQSREKQPNLSTRLVNRTRDIRIITDQYRTSISRRGTFKLDVQLQWTTDIAIKMKRPAGLPAIGRTTVLGLNIAKTLENSSWFGLKPRTTAATPTKSPHVVEKSSLSTKSHDMAKLPLLEPLDACIQKNGAMDPFHTLFNQSLLNVGAVDPKNEGIASSMEPLQTPSVPYLEGFGVRTAMQAPVAADCVHGGTHQSVGHPTAPVNEQVPPFTISSSYLGDEDQMAPFSALFPHYLLSDSGEDMLKTSKIAVPVLETSTLRHLHTQSIQMPFDQILDINTTSTGAHDLDRLNTGTTSNEYGGRASPQPSTVSGEHSEGLSDSLDCSRRSSWATSISTYREDGDSDESNKLAAEAYQNVDKIELIQEYDYYCELIDVGHPRNCRDRDFIASLPDDEGGNEVLTAELDNQSASGPTISVHRDIACGCPETPATQAAPDLPEQPAQPEASTDSEMDRRPSTPAEAAAWAHSYCDTDPESAKLKILKDERGREYVLYHDCFHCVPIELAPEFAHVVDEEDDGYGSATETSETAKDGTKLVTIPEEEDEG